MQNLTLNVSSKAVFDGALGLATRQRHHGARRTEARRIGAYSLDDVILRHVPVVPFDHGGVAMPEVLGDDEQRYAVHHRMRGPGVAQSVKRDVRRDLGPCHRLAHRSALIAELPVAAVGMPEHDLTTATAGAPLKEECG